MAWDSCQSASQWNSTLREPASSRTTWRIELARPTRCSNATSARSGPLASTSHDSAGGQSATVSRWNGSTSQASNCVGRSS